MARLSGRDEPIDLGALARGDGRLDRQVGPWLELRAGREPEEGQQRQGAP